MFNRATLASRKIPRPIAHSSLNGRAGKNAYRRRRATISRDGRRDTMFHRHDPAVSSRQAASRLDAGVESIYVHGQFSTVVEVEDHAYHVAPLQQVRFEVEGPSMDDIPIEPPFAVQRRHDVIVTHNANDDPAATAELRHDEFGIMPAG